VEDNIEAVDPPVGVGGSRVAVHTPHILEAVVLGGNMPGVAVGGTHLGVDKHKADKA